MFTDAIRDLPDIVIQHDALIENKVPTIAITVERLSAADLATALRANGIVASSGFQCAPQVHQTLGTQTAGVTRFSFGPKTTASEVQAAIEILRRVIVTTPT